MRIVGGEHDDRQLLIDQRVGTVLHFAGGIAFGVDVGDLLQLERAFERDGEMHAAAEEQEVGGAVQLACRALRTCASWESTVSSLPGRRTQFLHEAARLLFVEVAVGLAQVHGEDEERGQLAGEGLGGGDADFRTGVGIDGAGGLARDHGADHVADGERASSPLLLASRCAASVSAVSPDCEMTTVSVSGVDDGVAIAELAAVIHFDGNARQLLDHELAGERRRASWCRRR